MTTETQEMLEDFEPDFTADGVVRGELVGDPIAPEPAGGQGFGERLRRWVSQEQGFDFVTEPCSAIADAIDRDAQELRDEMAGRLTSRYEAGARHAGLVLRAQIERLAEELRYTTDYAGAGQQGSRDVLDAEPFLERLRSIFAEG